MKEMSKYLGHVRCIDLELYKLSMVVFNNPVPTLQTRALRMAGENSTNETPTLGSSRIWAPRIETIRLTLTPVDVKVLNHVEVRVRTVFLVSIVVSIPASHVGDRGSIPRWGGTYNPKHTAVF